MRGKQLPVADNEMGANATVYGPADARRVYTGDGGRNQCQSARVEDSRSRNQAESSNL